MPFLRKYNTLTVTGTTAIRIPVIKRAAVDFAVSADWTPAAGDVKIAVDGAAAANVTNLPTAVAMGNAAYWEFILTAAELSCKSAVVTVADSATKAVEDQSFIVETFGHASAMYQADLSAANLPANVTQWLGTAPATPTVAGVPEVDVTHYAGSTTSVSTIPASVASILDDTGTSGVVVASASKTGYTLTATTGLGNQTADITGTITTATNVTTVNGIGANVITASALATDAVAEIADGVWDEDATGHQTQGTFGQAIGDPVADTNSIFKATVTDATGATVGVDVAAVLDDTGTAGVVVASGSKTGYTLTATTGLGNQTANITGTITTVTTATNVTTVNGIGAGVITAASIATGAIDADSLATDAVSEIADGVWDEALAGHAGAGSAGLALSTASSGGVDPSVLADAIWDEALSGHTTAGSAGKAVSDILVDTAEIGTAGAGLTALATQASVNTIDDFLDTEIAAIKAKTDTIPANPASTTNITAATGITVATIGANVITASALATDAVDEIVDGVWDELLTGATHNITSSAGKRLRQINALQQVDGTVNDAGATATSFITDLASSVDNFYNDSMLVFNSGALTGQVRAITDYVGATKTITLEEALTSAPANGVEFSIISMHIHPVSQIQSGLATQTSVNDLPTNAELATALAAADDAVLAAIAALNNLSAAQVNAEMVDVLTTDTFAELASPPAATSSLKDKLTWMFMWARNKSTETASQRKLYADDTTTVVSTEGVTDDGTTFTKTEAS
jgi:hypothetical protein